MEIYQFLGIDMLWELIGNVKKRKKSCSDAFGAWGYKKNKDMLANILKTSKIFPISKDLLVY